MIGEQKKKTIIFLAVMTLVLVCCLYMDVKYNENIKFSKASGFYNEEFDLQIIGGGGNLIYYTLDGRIPTKEDYLYNNKEAIHIADATDNKNVYSARTDTSTAFSIDLVEHYSGNNPNYTIPDYNVDKCNIVRAAVFDSQGNCLDMIDGIYFVGFDNKTGYDNIYIASIITDPENLFGYEQGIYNTGVIFDEYVDKGFDPENSKTAYWWWWEANYRKEGMDGEREAVVTIYNQNREQILNENCGIRIQGGGSRGYIQKSIGCYARSVYGGSREFKTALFEKNKFPHKFVFFSGGDDNIFKLKDYMVQYMESKLNFSTMHYIPCALFLDGEYWGIYYIAESYNDDFVSDYYGVDRENIIIVKSGLISEGEESDLNLFTEIKNFITDNDMTIAEHYNQACEFIDMDSYIDYYAAQFYIGRNSDWPFSNWAAWSAREDDGTMYGDQRWRWMLFDVNSGGLDINQMDDNVILQAFEQDPVFYSLYQNETFRIELANKMLYIGKEIFSIDKCESFLTEYVSVMKEPIMHSNKRFFNESREEEFDLNVGNILQFFTERYDAVWKLLINTMGEEWLAQNEIQK